MLRAADQATLDELGLATTTSSDGAFLALVVESYPMPAGIEPSTARLLLRLPPGFPDAAPDMFWLEPAVRLSGGAPIPGTESIESYVGGTWQRWSRHIQGQWRPGLDNLGTYLAYVQVCLHEAVAKAA